MAWRRPEADTWSASDVAYRELCRSGRFALQSCRGCGHIVFPPSPVCPGCLDSDLEWVDAAPSGVINSWTRFHRDYFKELPAPYVCLAIELDDGPLFITGWDDCCLDVTPLLGSRVALRVVHFENLSLPLAHQADDVEVS